jgi:NitT/TauT family transport system ATP-binding protein
MNNISKSFDEVRVLEDFSLHLSGCGLAVVMGASGRGKSTLLSLIAKTELPDSGEISVDGTVSFSFQDDTLMPWFSALENVAAVSDKETATHWLSLLGLEDALDKYPDELSGGMKQRVNLARCFAFGGDILLLDEPFRALDAALRETLAAVIAEQAQSKLVVMVTHDYGEAELILSCGAKLVEKIVLE